MNSLCMLFEGQLDDDSYQINMSAPCKCVTYKCGGNIVSRKTLRKHAELDYQKLNPTHHALNECALDTPRLTTPALRLLIKLVLSLIPRYTKVQLSGNTFFLNFANLCLIRAMQNGPSVITSGMTENSNYQNRITGRQHSIYATEAPQLLRC